MTISEKELQEDFMRWIRHEAMRANVSQAAVISMIQMPMKEVVMSERAKRV